MQAFFEAAFRPKASVDHKGYALLPKQSQNELYLSSVHANLDRVLVFLQRDIGYVLLDDARPRRGGGVRLQPPPSPLHSRAAGPRGHKSTRIPKGEPQVDEEETKQVIRFSTDTAKYAQYPDDLVLMWRFTNILANSSPECRGIVKQETLYKTVLQGIRLMHLCSYDYSDLVLTLAYASVYFRSTCEAVGHQMSDIEAAHVCVLLIFLAHCFVIDETCPLRYWQKYIFKKYCTLKVLDAALFRVFQMRNFQLKISEEEERTALSVLLCTENGREIILRFNEGADPQSVVMSVCAGSSPSSPVEDRTGTEAAPSLKEEQEEEDSAAPRRGSKGAKSEKPEEKRHSGHHHNGHNGRSKKGHRGEDAASKHSSLNSYKGEDAGSKHPSLNSTSSARGSRKAEGKKELELESARQGEYSGRRRGSSNSIISCSTEAGSSREPTPMEVPMPVDIVLKAHLTPAIPQRQDCRVAAAC